MTYIQMMLDLDDYHFLLNRWCDGIERLHRQEFPERHKKVEDDMAGDLEIRPLPPRLRVGEMAVCVRETMEIGNLLQVDPGTKAKVLNLNPAKRTVELVFPAEDNYTGVYKMEDWAPHGPINEVSCVESVTGIPSAEDCKTVIRQVEENLRVNAPNLATRCECRNSFGHRCTLVQGHAGDHLSSRDETFPQERDLAAGDPVISLSPPE